VVDKDKPYMDLTGWMEKNRGYYIKEEVIKAEEEFVGKDE